LIIVDDTAMNSDWTIAANGIIVEGMEIVHIRQVNLLLVAGIASGRVHTARFCHIMGGIELTTISPNMQVLMGKSFSVIGIITPTIRGKHSDDSLRPCSSHAEAHDM
jgi:hypothetical protein